MTQKTTAYKCNDSFDRFLNSRGKCTGNQENYVTNMEMNNIWQNAVHVCKLVRRQNLTGKTVYETEASLWGNEGGEIFGRYDMYVPVFRTTLLQLPAGSNCGRQTLMMEAVNPSKTWQQSNSLHGMMCRQTVASVGRDKLMSCIQLEKGRVTSDRLMWWRWRNVMWTEILQWRFDCGDGNVNPYPTAFPYGNGMVLHFYQQQESSTTKTVHNVINKGLKTYV